jgi:hypothetical protein
VHVASIRPQIQDGIADELPGTVIGDVAAASRLVHFDSPCGERLGRCDQMSSCCVCLHPKGDDMRMLEQEKHVRDPPGSPLFDERALHIACNGIRNEAEPLDL